MEETIKQWIAAFQQQGDQEALEHLREACWPVVERLIDQLAMKHGAEIEKLLCEKGMERFPFIFSKYQLEVQLPLETFLTNTYRFYFMQVLNEHQSKKET
ncbi:hypothetical protein [Bacillus xiapuensis]|uniref:hypothetical protein n=1 Tax=Bacillus xiapuensis TaxID=2014075 RepID=UPI000C2371BB|nr:hypothetical protein [Bacillus xiapuensis]